MKHQISSAFSGRNEKPPNASAKRKSAREKSDVSDITWKWNVLTLL